MEQLLGTVRRQESQQGNLNLGLAPSMKQLWRAEPIPMQVPEATNGAMNCATLFTGTKLASKGKTVQYINPIIKDGIKMVKLDKADLERRQRCEKLQ